MSTVELYVLRKLVAVNSLWEEAITDLLARRKVSLEKEYASAVSVINDFI